MACNPQYLPCTPCGSQEPFSFWLEVLGRETVRLSHCLLRDHGSLTPGTIPLRSLGVTAHGRTRSRFNARPVTTQKYHYHFVSVIASLGLQPRFWLIPLIALSLSGGLGGFGVNLARYFNADTSNVPSGLVFNCQGPVKGFSLSWKRIEELVPSPLLDKWPVFCTHFWRWIFKKMKKLPMVLKNAYTLGEKSAFMSK